MRTSGEQEGPATTDSAPALDLAEYLELQCFSGLISCAANSRWGA